MGLIKDLKKLASGTWKLIGPTFDVLEDIATGDVDLETARDIAQMIEDSWDLSDEIESVARFQAQLAAALALAQVATWVNAGNLNPLIDARIGRATAQIFGPVASVWERLKKEEQRLKGILDLAGIRQAIRTTQILHRLGLIISPEYRERVSRFFDSVRGLSEDVFGDAQTLNSGLNLIQMSIYDITALQGEPVDVAHNRYFATATQVSNRVANRSRQYSRNPGQFLYDLNQLYLDPLQDEKMILERERSGNLDRALDRVSELTTTADTLSNRFDDYREHLNQFLDEDKLRELDTIRRNFDVEVLQPLEDMDTFLAETFPEVERELDTLDASVTQIQGELSAVSEIVTDPQELDPDAQERQRERINSILDNALQLTGTPLERLQAAQNRVQSLFDQLEE